jgi:hypothetical protein
MATNYTEWKWEAQLAWSQVYRQEPRKLEKICRQPMFLMELRTLLLLLNKIVHHLWNKKFHCRIQKAHQRSISSSTQIQLSPFHSISLTSISKLSCYLRLGLASVLFPLGFSTHPYFISHMRYIPHTCHLSLFDHSNRIWRPCHSSSG